MSRDVIESIIDVGSGFFLSVNQSTRPIRLAGAFLGIAPRTEKTPGFRGSPIG